MSHLPTALVTRAAIAAGELPERTRDGARRRLDRLRKDGESGAQVAEYAMLGGVSAAACGALVALLRNPDVLRTVVDAVISFITSSVGTWGS